MIPRGPSFSDPGTHFEIDRSETPVSVDGFKIGEPTGLVVCGECGESAHCVDRINHALVDGEACPQADVKSAYAQQRSD